MASQKTKTVTISSGTSLSGEVDLGPYELVAIHMPAGWDAADLTFQAADSPGGTFHDLYDDDGNEVTVTAAASRAIAVKSDEKALAPLHAIKIRSGTSGVPVNQTADRTLTLILKE